MDGRAGPDDAARDDAARDDARSGDARRDDARPGGPGPDDARRGGAARDGTGPRRTAAPDDDGGDAAPDLAAALAIIAEGRQQARAAYPSGAFLFLLWGAVWLVGYGTLWVSARESGRPAGAAAAVAIGLGVAGLVGTLTHIARRSRGLSGASARTGALYGWSWAIGFTAQALIVTSLAEAGASPQVSALAGNALAALVVGLLYLAAGALWDDVPMFALGAWITLVGAASALVGMPGTYLAMALAGGGGMVAVGAVEALRERRRRA
ncbi:hypothetical protein [Cellulomonas fimi]|uniref:Uncharacterized protein n=1 Tax=Cellulomonas fimi (strain ATCC 484 / DSM 20113 / JCM 1341 / CCUG 24087 / LMG 16345 / NBRC 15513 / NCIMB 8980 / NCTC 7547 / NRS-133) TaxID=590998 RepID=F4H5P5_CELFA|nr:hypothetical protein [Cellulomonas fimi]AEE44369.1 hypothetical protein Celf_0223 [Cellulomonas fimi ATCC 484]NNH08651.1 hypothetical protein [Cellulomonas fimi]VEH26220.1 Uncharacterised protein [Cellulomonas fimi]